MRRETLPLEMSLGARAKKPFFPLTFRGPFPRRARRRHATKCPGGPFAKQETHVTAAQAEVEGRLVIRRPLGLEITRRSRPRGRALESRGRAVPILPSRSPSSFLPSPSDFPFPSFLSPSLSLPFPLCFPIPFSLLTLSLLLFSFLSTGKGKTEEKAAMPEKGRREERKRRKESGTKRGEKEGKTGKGERQGRGQQLGHSTMGRTWSWRRRISAHPKAY